MSDQQPTPSIGGNAGRDYIDNRGATFNVAGDMHVGGATAPPSPPPNLHNLPPLTSRFVERPAELEAVHAILTANAHKGASLRAGFRGHGGQGKSTLALAYAWKCRDAAHPWHNTYPGGTYIISCGAGNEGQANTSILAEVAALAPACGAKVEQDSRHTAANVKATLERGQLSLIILDNVTSEDQWLSDEFAALLPATNCRYLITTRAAHLADIEEVPVGYLTPAQAIKLLDNYKPIGTSQAEQAAAAKIADWLGGLAVALAAVGSMLRRTPSSTYAAYWKVLQAKPVIDLPGGDPATAKEIMYQGRAATVIDDAYDALRAPGSTTDSPEQRALQYAALLPQDMIPRPWLIELLEADATRDPAEGGITMTAPDGVPVTPAQYALQRLLDDATLTTKDETGNLLALHRLWHARVNEREKEEKRDTASHWVAIAACASGRRAVIVGADASGKDRGIDNPAVLIDQNLRWELTPLAKVCQGLWVRGHVGAAAAVGVWAGYVLRLLGRFTEALACLQLSDETDATVAAAIGNEKLATAYSTLAMIQRYQGDLRGGRVSIEKAIAIDVEHFAPDHLGLATRYSNLAMIQRAQGDLREARVSMYRAIAIESEYLPPDHLNFASSYSNLALIQMALGELATALGNMKRTIAIKLAHLGPDHYSLANSFSNLATIQHDLGNLSAARASVERAIEIDSKHFALDHPTFATRYSNLAMIQFAQGDLSGARASMERAIAIEGKHFPPDHPNFAISHSNLSQIQQALGDSLGARANIETTFAIDSTHFDPNHPTFATSYSNLAMIQRAQGDLCGARASMERAIAIESKHFDPDHPTFGISYTNLASISHAEGDRVAACASFRKALGILLKHFEDDHPNVKTVRDWMRFVGCASGD